jgi:N-methylhydantoinase A
MAEQKKGRADVSRYYVGVDIGGTFTDCVALSETGAALSAKVPTSGSAPGSSVLNGLAELAKLASMDVDDFLSQTARLGHGTTIGTNALIERKGAQMLLLTTAGHGDAILMMRGGGRVAGLAPEEFYAIHGTDKPQPLVPPERIVSVQERIDSTGAIVLELDEETLAKQVAEAVDRFQVTSVAICFLWSFVNNVHERLAAAVVRDVAPHLFVSLSSEVAPRLGEYERAVASVINAYIGPVSTGYFDELQQDLASRSLERPVVIMQSNGGALPARAIQRTPIRIIDSGPVGGLSAVSRLADAYGHGNVIATDMGGTSFDVGLIVEGSALASHERVVEQYTYRLPHIEVRSIACGGGSIARYEPHTESMRVGPESAGAVPGPACYGLGGTEPTVTDAGVVLGLLSAGSFLGGSMHLDEDAAHKAMGTLARSLHLSVPETAAGIITINDNKAATLIRQQTIHRGYDPRDFVIYAYGGAGPVHAFDYAREIGAREIVIPLANGASTLSAFGIASTDMVQQLETEVAIRAPFVPQQLTGLLSELARKARESMLDLGIGLTELGTAQYVLMRYPGQYMHSITIEVPGTELTEGDCRTIRNQFTSEYQRRFGTGADDVFGAPEIFAVSVKLTVPYGGASLSFETDGRGARADAEARDRSVFWPDRREWIRTRVYLGETFPLGSSTDGPCIIDLPHTTVVVGSGQRAIRDELGSFRIRMGEGATVR